MLMLAVDFFTNWRSMRDHAIKMKGHDPHVAELRDFNHSKSLSIAQFHSSGGNSILKGKQLKWVWSIYDGGYNIAPITKKLAKEFVVMDS